MDDWALATVADLEDRTRVRSVAGSSAPVAPGRRRRRVAAVADNYDAVGTLIKGNSDNRNTAGDRGQGNRTVGNRSQGHRSLGQRGSTRAPVGKRMQLLAWILVACSVLVIALGATATLVLIRSSSNDIPVVSDIASSINGETVTFTWDDPGLADADAYQIQLDGDTQSVQSTAEFVADGSPGDYTCMTVRVSRDGRLGEPSNPKCVDIPG